MPMGSSPTHPPKVQKRGQAVRDELISECERLLMAGTPPDQIKLAEILEATGVARATVYHHFGDLEGMAGQATLTLFARHVANDLKVMNSLVDNASTAAEFARGLRELTHISQSPERRASRLLRARLIAYAVTRPALSDELGRLQNSLTNTAENVFAEAQQRGWLRADVSCRAIGIFIQAYSLGRIVDDIATDHVDPEDWEQLIHLIAGSLLTAET